MGRRKNPHYPSIPTWLADYANARTFDFERYSPFHMRLTDGGYTVLDVWTSGKYYVLQTDYATLAMNTNAPVERGGEKGEIPHNKKKELFEWLDKLFFAVELV